MSQPIEKGGYRRLVDGGVECDGARNLPRSRSTSTDGGIRS